MSNRIPDPFIDFALPATDLAVAAYSFAQSAETPVVFAHSVRSYLYARELAARLHPDAGYDDELLFLSCVLHDIGLSELGNGDQRFEVDGADTAASFLREHGVAEQRVRIVWDAVALHTSDGIAGRREPEVALAQVGISADVLGRNREQLPVELVERVHAVYPRADLSFALTEEILAQTHGKPSKASPVSFPGLLLRARLPYGEIPDWHDLMGVTGWGDRPPAARTPELAGTPEELAELFEKRLAAGDLDGLVELYEPGAVLAPAPGTVVAGADAIRESLRDYIAAGARVSLSLRQIHTAGDIALLSSDATVTGLASQPLTTTTTEVARRQPDGRWLYAVDHPFFGE
ncbi:nuclear transport factor 2 family protein [Nocardia sp. NPDC056611]|uniref:nuclear transport factor 2 family protein n=1 Tax=Nocardia sp. NPDC056611 TaxID=3345877 RepID=UPI00366E127B